jgi:hypothetical protein
MDVISIDLPRLCSRDEYMPIVVGTISDGIDVNDSCRPGVVFPLKKQQLYACGFAGENTKVDAIGCDRGAKGRA